MRMHVVDISLINNSSTFGRVYDLLFNVQRLCLLPPSLTPNTFSIFHSLFYILHSSSSRLVSFVSFSYLLLFYSFLLFSFRIAIRAFSSLLKCCTGTFTSVIIFNIAACLFHLIFFPFFIHFIYYFYIGIDCI